MHRIVAAVAAVTAATAALTACGSSGSGGGGGGGGTDKITVGVIPIVDVAPIYLAKQNGYFAAQHIQVTLQPESGGAAAVPGVVSGQFKFAFGNVVSLILAESKHLPLRMVANGNASTGVAGKDFSAVVVPRDSPIKTAKDLVGKTVSVNNLKNVGDTTVRASIRKAGGDATKVRFVEMGFPDMPAALQKHRVDAAWVVEPFLTAAKQQGARVVAWNMVDTAPHMTVATYFTSEKVLKDDPDLVKRFKAAIGEGLAYAQSHPDAVRKILGTYTKISPSVAQQMTLPAWPPKVNEQSVRTLARLMQQDGLIKQQPDLPALLPS
ncbi:MAG TPA: ABC transporter substrate-binding protein [Streptosporangiales bacterium]